MSRASDFPVVIESPRRQQAPRPDVNDKSMLRTRSTVEIQRYAEDEGDEDFSDIFGQAGNTLRRDDSDSGSDRALMLHSKLSNNSWVSLTD
jgi:hypothetical protein